MAAQTELVSFPLTSWGDWGSRPADDRTLHSISKDQAAYAVGVLRLSKVTALERCPTPLVAAKMQQVDWLELVSTCAAQGAHDEVGCNDDEVHHRREEPAQNG